MTLPALASAELSDEKPTPLYRYTLTREWEYGLPFVAWMLLNPSKATGEIDDPTVVKCREFAKRWLFGGMILLNLFAWRATRPEQLLTADNPVGPLNDPWITQILDDPRITAVICGWGTGNAAASLIPDRELQVDDLLRASNLAGHTYCLGRNRGGTPKHPLYLSYTTPRTPFAVEEK